MKVTNLHRYGEGNTYQLKNRITGETLEGEHTHTGGWQWDETDENGKVIFECRTDKDGCGLWINGRQVEGTSQYTAAKTASGQRQKIKRERAEAWVDYEAMNA